MAKKKKKYELNSGMFEAYQEGNQQELDRQKIHEQIRSELENLDPNLNQRIDEMRTREDLDSLKNELENLQISEELRSKLHEMIEQIQATSAEKLDEIKREIQASQIEIPEIIQDVFPSHQFEFVRDLENSPLGKNVAKDVAGILVGTVDSAAAIFKLAFTLLKDVFLLPRDIVRSLRK